jgi:hypothetical protein
MKTRQIEMLRCWGDHTWDTDFTEIPANTPEGDIDRVAIDGHTSEIFKANPKRDLVQTTVYHIPEIEEEEPVGLLGAN